MSVMGVEVMRCEYGISFDFVRRLRRSVQSLKSFILGFNVS